MIAVLFFFILICFIVWGVFHYTATTIKTPEQFVSTLKILGKVLLVSIISVIIISIFVYLF